MTTLHSLDGLPVELVLLVARLLSFQEIKQLSTVNKRLRAICLSSIFQSVRFKFSRSSMNNLKTLFTSEIRHHVRSFTYIVPEFLKPDVIDFDSFTTSILTPETYVKEAKSLYDYGRPPDEYPPYLVIFLSLQKLCRKQNLIVQSGIDQAALTLAFRAFPCLRELTVHFCTATNQPDWLEYYLNMDMTMTLKSYEHHVRVISEALSYAKSRGSLVDTVHLLGLQIPTSQYDVPDLMSLSVHLKELLSGISCFKVTQSELVLDLLSLCGLGIHEFDMCYMTVDYRTLKRFLTANRSTLSSIGVHNVLISDVPFHEEPLPFLNVDILYTLLNKQGRGRSQETECHCPPRQWGWRVLLEDGNREETED